MTPDYSSSSLLEILNRGISDEGKPVTVLDDDTMNYLMGALVFIELARLRIVDPNSLSGVFGSRGGGAPDSKLEDTFRIRQGVEGVDGLTKEYVTLLPPISTIHHDGSALGRYIFGKETVGIDPMMPWMAPIRLELIERYGSIATGGVDHEGDLYVARSLAALLSYSPAGRSISARLGDVPQSDVVHITTQQSVWGENATSTTVLVVIAMICGIVAAELTRRFA